MGPSWNTMTMNINKNPQNPVWNKFVLKILYGIVFDGISYRGWKMFHFASQNFKLLAVLLGLELPPGG